MVHRENDHAARGSSWLPGSGGGRCELEAPAHKVLCYVSNSTLEIKPTGYVKQKDLELPRVRVEVAHVVEHDRGKNVDHAEGVLDGQRRAEEEHAQQSRQDDRDRGGVAF
jgi:hypothetical protein